MENGAKSSSSLWMKIAIILLAAVLVFSAGYVALRNINRSMFQERSTNIQILMSRITLSIEDSMEKEWNYLTYFENAFSRAAVPNLEEAEALMRQMEEDSSHNIHGLLLIDEDGFCYPSEGERFRWLDARELRPDQKSCSIYSIALQDGREEPYMFFVMPFDAPLAVEGVSMTHIAMAVTLEFVDTFFEAEEFGEHSAAFVLDPNGSQIYWQKNDNPLAGVYNILRALEDADFYYEATIEQVARDIADRQEGCVGLDYHGKAYYLAYEPLSYNNWMSVVLIEQETFSSGTSGFVRSVVASLIFVAAVTLASILAIILLTIRSANRRLKRAMETEQKANAAKTTFFSSMSHDIRTPMNAISGMTELALGHIDDKEYVQECLRKVKLAARHLLTLVNDVLDISKVESGRMTLNPVSFSLKEAVESLADILAPQISEKEQEFQLHTEELTTEYVYADMVRLNQIMLNLLSNAVKYTPAGGRICVELKGSPLPDAEQMQFVYIVRDNGLGMTKEFQKIMYSSFARENNAPQKNIQGTGLGLAICKQMVDLMGGVIDCESAVGKGTTFTVTLEMPIAPASAAAPPSAGQPAADSSADSLKGMHLLVAEDNDFNWEIAKEILAMYGAAAQRAETGKRAVEMMQQAKDGAYDLILMDVQMPELNGYEATAAIRSSPRPYLKTIPIVAMTADAFSEDIQRCLDVGMNAHLPKPIDIALFLRVIQSVRSAAGSAGRA